MEASQKNLFLLESEEVFNKFYNGKGNTNTKTIRQRRWWPRRKRIKRLKDPIEDKDAVNRAYFRDIKGNVNADGYITGKKAGLYLTADPDDPANTFTISSGDVDTWLDIVLGLNIRLLEDFSIGPGGLVYTGEKKQYFKVHGYFVVSSSIANPTVHYAIEKNGVVDDDSITSAFFRFVNQEQAAPFLYITELEKDDVLVVKIQSDSATTLTFNHTGVGINEFFD